MNLKVPPVAKPVGLFSFTRASAGGEQVSIPQNPVFFADCPRLSGIDHW